jgi:hypothetical protein
MCFPCNVPFLRYFSDRRPSEGCGSRSVYPPRCQSVARADRTVRRRTSTNQAGAQAESTPTAEDVAALGLARLRGTRGKMLPIGRGRSSARMSATKPTLSIGFERLHAPGLGTPSSEGIFSGRPARAAARIPRCTTRTTQNHWRWSGFAEAATCASITALIGCHRVTKLLDGKWASRETQ